MKKDRLENILEAMLSTGGDFAEIFMENKKNTVFNYIDSNIKIKLKDINSYENILSNEEMLEVLNVLLEKGDISYDDYLEFIYGEELYETQ